MSVLNIDPAGLRELARRCEAWSEEVTVDLGSVDVSVHATAAAVNAVNTRVGVVGRVLSGRMRSDAALLTTAAARCSDDDDVGAATFSALTRGW